MYFQASRLHSRVDSGGTLLLLEDQDREQWDKKMISRGFDHFDLASSGRELTRYHIEAAIASCHALAKNYAIRVESFNLPIARANVLAEYGKFDPSLQLQYNYQESGNPQPADPFSGVHPSSSVVATDTYDVGLVGLIPWGLQYNVGGSTENRRGTFNQFTPQFYSFTGVDLKQPLLRDFGLTAGLYTVRIAKTDRAL